MTDQNKIQEMQILDQNLQSIMMQKQAFQIELRETESALEEVKKSGEDVFKVIGQLMIKSDKKAIVGDLTKKKELLELRMKTIEKQEKTLTSRLESLREEILGEGSSEKKPKTSEKKK